MNSHQIHVDDEGFLTEYDEWDENLAVVLANQIGIDLTDAHWKVIRFLREDYKTQGDTATTRRVQAVGGVPVKEQFALFPKKPAKKMAYIAGLPKPHGCV
ncbi:MAG TPA: TusE/DsrC/DsvC family sulfur relay protein [Jiangellaceae bacterium]|nr:TusE/DsrC/DsvC family sulfur relay protein [Jiangellaceae bacterium]